MAIRVKTLPDWPFRSAKTRNSYQNFIPESIDSANFELPFLDKLEMAEKSASYAGWTLESLNKSYMAGEIDVSEFEELVELVLLEAIDPQEKRGGVERPQQRAQDIQSWYDQRMILQRPLLSVSLYDDNIHQRSPK